MLRYKTETTPGLVALYDIRPGNGAGQFLQPRNPHGAEPKPEGSIIGVGFLGKRSKPSSHQLGGSREARYAPNGIWVRATADKRLSNKSSISGSECCNRRYYMYTGPLQVKKTKQSSHYARYTVETASGMRDA